MHFMPVSMYTISISVFIQHLNGLNTVLGKAAAWAPARKVNTIEYLKSFKPSEFDGTEGKEITVSFTSGQTCQFTGQTYCSATVCRTSGFTPPPPTTSSGSAASSSPSATSWARHRHDPIECT
jgi:hypothetical protein